MSDREYVRLLLKPISLAEAKRFIADVHRHNDPPTGHRVSIGIEDESGVLRGVGVIGRPLARNSDNGYTAEIYRVATDGVPNGCSMLYGALTRAAWAMGYRTEGGRRMTRWIAPWNADQLRALRWWQRTGAFHPYTCPHHSVMSLSATRYGWRCPVPSCDYRQNWAHAVADSLMWCSCGDSLESPEEVADGRCVTCQLTAGAA